MLTLFRRQLVVKDEGAKDKYITRLRRVVPFAGSILEHIQQPSLQAYSVKAWPHHT